MALYSFRVATLCMAQSAVAASGIAAGDPDGPSLTETDQVFVQLYPPSDQPKAFDVLPDIIWTPGKTFCVISTSTKDVIMQCTIGSEIAFIPATIQDSTENVRSDDYWLMYSSAEHEVADYERSDVSWCDDIPVSVRKWVVDSEKIPSLDLFYASPNDWFATEELKYAFELNGISGAKFAAVEET